MQVSGLSSDANQSAERPVDKSPGHGGWVAIEGATRLLTPIVPVSRCAYGVWGLWTESGDSSKLSSKRGAIWLVVALRPELAPNLLVRHDDATSLRP